MIRPRVARPRPLLLCILLGPAVTLLGAGGLPAQVLMETGARAAGFARAARRDGRSWPEPITTTGNGSFAARDRDDALAAGGMVTCELRHDGDLIGKASLDLGLPPPYARLLAVAPDPFNPTTSIIFTAPRPQHVVVAVHDLAGRRLATLVDADYAVGDHALRWDGTDGGGRALPSGAYVLRLASELQVQSRVVSLVG